MKKTESYEEKISRIVRTAEEAGQLESDRYLLTIGDVGMPDAIWVFNKSTEKAEAFSFMKADFTSSLREFVEDYFA